MNRRKALSKLIALVLFVSMFAGVSPVAAAEPTPIFSGISINPYVIAENVPTSITLHATHRGRPIVSIPCNYEFYIVDSETAAPVVGSRVEVTLPSNGGWLDLILEDVSLPKGNYTIRFDYINSLGVREGSLYFTPFIVASKPDPASIRLFSIQETQLSVMGGSAPYYASQYGTVDNETGVINVDMGIYHNNLAHAEATVTLAGEGIFTVENEIERVNENTFIADFTKPVSISVKSEETSDTKDYTVIVTNADGSAANLGGGYFNYYARDGEIHYWNGIWFDEESGEFEVTIPNRLSDVDGFSVSISPSFGASLKIDDDVYGGLYRSSSMEGRSYSIDFGLSFLSSADQPYIFTIISADGTVTKDYTIRVKSSAPSIWWDEQYCAGIYYGQFLESVTEPIPLGNLQDVHIMLAGQFLERMLALNATPDAMPDAMLHFESRDRDNPSPSYFVQQREFPHRISLWDGFGSGDALFPGEYDVVLVLLFPPTDETPWQTQEQYVLGGVTLIDMPRLSDDATLATLAVSSGILDPAFSPDETNYSVTVPNSVSSIDISAAANHAEASVSGAGTKALAVGVNSFDLVVTAEDETTQTYTVAVTREKSTEPPVDGGGNGGDNGGNNGNNGGDNGGNNGNNGGNNGGDNGSNNSGNNGSGGGSGDGTNTAPPYVKPGIETVTSTAPAPPAAPKKLAAPKVKVGKKQIKVTWKKSATKDISGYQVQYRVVGKKWATKNLNAKATSLTIKKLKPGKKYEVRIRAVKKSGGKTVYGSWSKTIKSGKVKR